MRFIESGSKQWEEKQGYSKRILLEREDLKRPFDLIQEIKIKVGETAKEHYHKKQTEIFYFSSKNGYWIVNDKKINPNIGDVLAIEPFDKHTAVNNSHKDYIYLALKINYDPNDIYWTKD